jgi:hypothetical protein
MQNETSLLQVLLGTKNATSLGMNRRPPWWDADRITTHLEGLRPSHETLTQNLAYLGPLPTCRMQTLINFIFHTKNNTDAFPLTTAVATFCCGMSEHTRSVNLTAQDSRSFVSRLSDRNVRPLKMTPESRTTTSHQTVRAHRANLHAPSCAMVILQNSPYNKS